MTFFLFIFDYLCSVHDIKSMKNLFYILLFGTSIPVLAQPCSQASYLEQLLRIQPEMQAKIQLHEKIIANFDLSQTSEERNVYLIPIVVHVVYENDAENISESQIRSQIEILNLDFRKKNYDVTFIPDVFTNISTDIGIEFCLANIDPQGKKSSGITRTKTEFSNIGSSFALGNRRRIYYSDLGGEDVWDTQKYLNIWVCSIGGGTLGLALGTLANAKEDGVLVDYQAFGTNGTAKAPYSLGRTCTHEIGHFFNLKHLWGDTENCTGDDLVADTPTQSAPYFGCPTYPQESCGTSNMFMNFMDYTDDSCRKIFTKGQKNRVLVTLLSLRPSLLNAQVCQFCKDTRSDLCIFPNPTNNFLTFNLSENQQVTVKIFDELGRFYFEEQLSPPVTGKSIFLKNLPSGIYIAKIQDASGRNDIQKFIISK